MDRQVLEAVQALAGTQLADKVLAFDAEVLSVDLAARTCICSVISAKGAIEIPDVRLMAAIDDGLLLVPAVESTVTIITSTYGDPYISSYSEVSTIVMLGGELGGMVRLLDLVSKLNTLEKDINGLKTAFAGWTVLPGDGGAALKVAATTWVSQTLTETKRADLENTKITQGQ